MLPAAWGRASAPLRSCCVGLGRRIAPQVSMPSRARGSPSSSTRPLAGPARSLALNGISRDDAANGRWLLSVEDTVAGVEGILIGWDLFVVSRWD